MNEPLWTADTHLGHQLVAQIRGFADVDEHDEMLIDNWNSVVTRNRIVYHLGDVGLGSKERLAAQLKRLNGQIYLLRGNHDRNVDHPCCAERFVWVKDWKGITVNEQRIYMFHRALRTWDAMHHGSWNLHGHSHGSLPELPNLKQCDVGVDCWDFKPVCFEQLAAKMETKRFEPVDHHGLRDGEAFAGYKTIVVPVEWQRCDDCNAWDDVDVDGLCPRCQTSF